MRCSWLSYMGGRFFMSPDNPDLNGSVKYSDGLSISDIVSGRIIAKIELECKVLWSVPTTRLFIENIKSDQTPET